MVNRHPLDGAGFFTKCTWDQDVALEGFMTFRSRSSSIIPCKAKCFSGDICRDGNLFAVVSQAASTVKSNGGTLADFPLTVVLKISWYFCTKIFRVVVIRIEP